MSDYAELGADDKYVQAFLDGGEYHLSCSMIALDGVLTCLNITAANPSRFKFFHKATDVTHHIRSTLSV